MGVVAHLLSRHVVHLYARLESLHALLCAVQLSLEPFQLLALFVLPGLVPHHLRDQLTHTFRQLRLHLAQSVLRFSIVLGGTMVHNAPP